jgi:hypothetical protein
VSSRPAWAIQQDPSSKQTDEQTDKQNCDTGNLKDNSCLLFT